MLNGGKPADTGSDIHADLIGIVFRNHKARILYRHLTRADGVLDEGIHFLKIFFVDIVVRVKVLHFAGDLAIVSARVELCDATNTGSSRAYSLPCLFDTGPEWRDQPQASDNDASFHDFSRHRSTRPLR